MVQGWECVGVFYHLKFSPFFIYYDLSHNVWKKVKNDMRTTLVEHAVS